MADIQHMQPRPAPGPPLPPPPPPTGPSSGSNTGQAVGASVGLAATHSSGGAGGKGNGRGGNGSGAIAVPEEQVEGTALGMDRSSLTSHGAGTMTLQAAISHFTRREVMAPSAADLTALKKALKEHGMGAGFGSSDRHQSATQETLAQMSEIQRVSYHDNKELDPFDQLGYDDPPLDGELADLLDGFANFDSAEDVFIEDRGDLCPARVGFAVRLAPELRPSTPDRHAHVLHLVRDPRAGLAPEGIAALELEHSRGTTLVRALSGRADFREASDAGTEPGALWSLLALRTGDTGFTDLTRAAKDADASKTHLLVDANGVGASPELARAIRTTSTAFPKVRVHLAMSAQGF